eukprot:maker-scaffold_6-snap-gene-11.68-mRNA-1 protein AED:0.16 eAED:0.16 QI:0/1/0.5/1/0/0.5/2/18/924
MDPEKNEDDVAELYPEITERLKSVPNFDFNSDEDLTGSENSSTTTQGPDPLSMNTTKPKSPDFLLSPVTNSENHENEDFNFANDLSDFENNLPVNSNFSLEHPVLPIPLKNNAILSSMNPIEPNIFKEYIFSELIPEDPVDIIPNLPDTRPKPVATGVKISALPLTPKDKFPEDLIAATRKFLCYPLRPSVIKIVTFPKLIKKNISPEFVKYCPENIIEKFKESLEVTFVKLVEFKSSTLLVVVYNVGLVSFIKLTLTKELKLEELGRFNFFDGDEEPTFQDLLDIVISEKPKMPVRVEVFNKSILFQTAARCFGCSADAIVKSNLSSSLQKSPVGEKVYTKPDIFKPIGLEGCSSFIYSSDLKTVLCTANFPTPGRLKQSIAHDLYIFNHMGEVEKFSVAEGQTLLGVQALSQGSILTLYVDETEQNRIYGLVLKNTENGFNSSLFYFNVDGVPQNYRAKIFNDAILLYENSDSFSTVFVLQVSVSRAKLIRFFTEDRIKALCFSKGQKNFEGVIYTIEGEGVNRTTVDFKNAENFILKAEEGSNSVKEEPDGTSADLGLASWEQPKPESRMLHDMHIGGLPDLSMHSEAGSPKILPQKPVALLKGGFDQQELVRSIMIEVNATMQTREHQLMKQVEAKFSSLSALDKTLGELKSEIVAVNKKLSVDKNIDFNSKRVEKAFENLFVQKLVPAVSSGVGEMTRQVKSAFSKNLSKDSKLTGIESRLYQVEKTLTDVKSILENLDRSNESVAQASSVSHPQGSRRKEEILKLLRVRGDVDISRVVSYLLSRDQNLGVLSEQEQDDLVSKVLIRVRDQGFDNDVDPKVILHIYRVIAKLISKPAFQQRGDLEVLVAALLQVIENGALKLSSIEDSETVGFVEKYSSALISALVNLQKGLNKSPELSSKLGKSFSLAQLLLKAVNRS